MGLCGFSKGLADAPESAGAEASELFSRVEVVMVDLLRHLLLCVPSVREAFHYLSVQPKRPEGSRQPCGKQQLHFGHPLFRTGSACGKIRACGRRYDRGRLLGGQLWTRFPTGLRGQGLADGPACAPPNEVLRPARQAFIVLLEGLAIGPVTGPEVGGADCCPRRVIAGSQDKTQHDDMFHCLWKLRRWYCDC